MPSTTPVKQTSNKVTSRYGNWQPRVTVATVVEKNGRYLCVEEYADPKNPEKLLINQPAGHVDNNETLIQAAERETLEETGWQVKVTHFLGIYTYQPNQSLTFYRYCFLAEPISHDPKRALDTGILTASWYTKAQLEAKNNLRSPLVLNCINDAAEAKRYPLEIIKECILPRPV